MIKNCVISGAVGNLGQAVVEQFTRAGYHVIGTVRKPTASSNPNIEYHAIDLTDEQAVASLIQQLIADKKRIHAATLLAGGFAMGNLSATSYQDLEKMFALNFKTAYTLIRPLFDHMIQTGGGTIIVIASKTAIESAEGKNAIAYTLSKSLLITLAEMLHADGKEKVHVHVIVPGIIDTEDNRKAMPDADTSTWVSTTTLAEKMVTLCETTFVKGGATLHKFY